jgi:hypothetical protein
MSMTYVTLHVGNVAAPQATVAVDFLVDSGATYSVVNATVLQRLGIEAYSEDSFFLANGEKITPRRGPPSSATVSARASRTWSLAKKVT